MKDIPNFEGLYAVTRDGRIWSYPKACTGAVAGKRSGKWLTQWQASNGYMMVNLGSRNRNRLVHRLVADTYLGPSDMHVNHIDGNKANNSVDNLERCTRSENMQHAVKLGLAKGARKIDIKDYDEIVRLSASGMSQTKIAELYGVGKSTIGRTLNWADQVGRRASHLAKLMESANERITRI